MISSPEVITAMEHHYHNIYHHQNVVQSNLHYASRQHEINSPIAPLDYVSFGENSSFMKEYHNSERASSSILAEKNMDHYLCV